MSAKNAAFVRKGRAFLKQWLKRINPPKVVMQGPLLVNSFPKSGTHLLYQVVKGLEGIHDYETFLASTPSLTMRERSQTQTLKKIASWIPGEIVRSHLYHSPVVEEALRAKKCLHLFIYRDPRDVVCSEAYYLAAMNRWHRLHKTFKSLPDEAARIQFAIEGDTKGLAPISYENIQKRFDHYRPWIDCPDSLAIRFEDLVGVKRDDTISAILANLRHQIPSLDSNATAECSAQIQPEKSHTFRKGGGVSSWQTRFTEEHKDAFKSIAGDLLIELGYEKDLNW